MRGINKVVLVGNSGKETELKTLQDGTPVAKLTIATTETYHLKNGETTSNTEWHPVIACAGWPHLPTNMFIKEVYFILKENCATANTKIKTGKRDT